MPSLVMFVSGEIGWLNKIEKYPSGTYAFEWKGIAGKQRSLPIFTKNDFVQLNKTENPSLKFETVILVFKSPEGDDYMPELLSVFKEKLEEEMWRRRHAEALVTELKDMLEVKDLPSKKEEEMLNMAQFVGQLSQRLHGYSEVPMGGMGGYPYGGELSPHYEEPLGLEPTLPPEYSASERVFTWGV